MHDPDFVPDGVQISNSISKLREVVEAVAFQLSSSTDNRGDVEFLAVSINEGLERISDSIESGLNSIADAIRVAHGDLPIVIKDSVKLDAFPCKCGHKESEHV